MAVLSLEARTRLGELDLDVSLTVPDGACLALAGLSGAGKTSVLRVVAGLIRPDTGRIMCGDETWLNTGERIDLPPEQRRCGYLFQDHALFSHLSALGNVAYPLRGLGRRLRRSRARELLERFGVAHLADARPHRLSGGERQRVALARALARPPAVLLLDEPLSALDARTRASAAYELAEVLREVEAPALLVTHDFAEAAELADRVGVIADGRLVQEGTSSELAARPSSAFVADFAGAVVLAGVARRGEHGLTEVELDGGGSVTSTDRASGPVAVTVYPWEVELEPAGTAHHGSARNHLAAKVVSVTRVGNRARVALTASQPLAAEVTAASLGRLAIGPGVRVTATWKAAATRIVARG